MRISNAAALNGEEVALGGAPQQTCGWLGVGHRRATDPPLTWGLEGLGVWDAQADFPAVIYGDCEGQIVRAGPGTVSAEGTPPSRFPSH